MATQPWPLLKKPWFHLVFVCNLETDFFKKSKRIDCTFALPIGSIHIRPQTEGRKYLETPIVVPSSPLSLSLYANSLYSGVNWKVNLNWPTESLKSLLHKKRKCSVDWQSEWQRTAIFAFFLFFFLFVVTLKMGLGHQNWCKHVQLI